MNLAAPPPKVFPQCLLYLMVSSYLLQTRSNVQTHSKQPIDTIKLPKLEIAKFGGDPTTWQQFYDSFTAAIHNSVSLTNVEKFNYLRSWLVDEALHCISVLPLTNENYENALILLKH